MSSFESVLMQLDTPTAENIVSILRGLVSDSSEAVTIENVVSSLQIILRLDEIAKSEDDSLCIPNFLVEIWNKYLALLKKYSNLLLRTFPASSTIAGKCSTLFSEVENVLKVYALEGIQSLLSLPNYSTDSIGNKRKLLHFFWYTYFIIVYSLLGVIIRTYMSHSQRLSATLALAGSYLTESSKRSATSVLCCYLGLFLTRMKAFEDEKKQACDLLLKAMPSSSESEFHGLLDSIHSGETFDAYTDSLLQSCGRSGYLHLCSLYLLGGTCAAGSVQSSLSVIQCMAAALSQLVCKNFAVLQDEWLEDLMHSSAESILHSARSFEPEDFRAFQVYALLRSNLLHLLHF